jgi:hypothetical protein
MFKSLKDLFAHQPRKAVWEEEDIRILTQDFLKEKLLTQAVYCDEARLGVLKIRVGSSANQQEVTLLEYELKEYLAEKSGYEVKRLIVWVSS